MIPDPGGMKMSPFAIIVLVFIAAAAIWIFGTILYTKKNGIEADAVITRIRESVDSDMDVTYEYDVRYIRSDGEMNGQEEEGVLSNPGFGKGLEVGAKIRIKYLPGNPRAVVWVKQEEGR
jgi:hypothetical protein